MADRAQTRHMLTHYTRMNRAVRAGFTLIETLVVVAIVALLVSIITPSLTRARAAARETACVANLRVWSAAFHLYASEHDGLLPHTDDRSRNHPPVHSPRLILSTNAATSTCWRR